MGNTTVENRNELGRAVNSLDTTTRRKERGYSRGSSTTTGGSTPKQAMGLIRDTDFALRRLKMAIG